MHMECAGAMPGVHKVLSNAIRRSDLDLRRVLYQNIVLSGGSTLFQVSVSRSCLRSELVLGPDMG
jgi:hypothetical protein